MSDNCNLSDKLRQTINETIDLTNDPEMSPLNESNTKGAIIEPVLEALGWNIRNPRIVEREYPTVAKTFVDYALKVDYEPSVLLEAKPLGSNLNDPKCIAQIVSYASNEGVEWCVLTDGIIWRIFKTNEPVSGSKKLVCEINLMEIDDPNAQVLELLQLLSLESVSRGELNNLGSKMFLDSKVLPIVEGMLKGEDQKCINNIQYKLSASKIKASSSEIRESLNRLYNGGIETIPHIKLSGTSAQNQDKTLVPSKCVSTKEKTNSQLTYTEKLVKWSSANKIHDILKQKLEQSSTELIKVELTTIQNLVNVHINGNYSGALEAQSSGIKVRSMLDIEAATALAPDLKERFVDCRGQHRWSRGATEILIIDESDVAAAVRLLTQTQ